MRVGPTELIIVLVIVILVFGIGKLPELGKSLGEGLHSFKKAQDEVSSEVKKVTSAIQEPAASSTPTETEQSVKTQPPPLPPQEEE